MNSKLNLKINTMTKMHQLTSENVNLKLSIIAN
jgi:hypothetical protein